MISMTTKTKPRKPAAPTTLLAELQAEQGGMDDAIRAARRAFDSDAWMRLVIRAEELPVEIAEIEAELLTTRLAQAWGGVDDALAVEVEHLAEYDRLRADPACRPLHQQLPAHVGRQELAEIEAAATLARARRDEAADRLNEAKRTTDLALDAVEQIEQQMDATGVDVPTGEGIRARPRPLVRTVGVRHGQSAWKLVDRLIQSGSASASGGATLTPGQTPPRWLAHRLDGHFFGAPLQHPLSETKETQ